jgi:hypothetical protein
MKGRRKAANHKWRAKFQFEAQASELLRSRSEQQGRLLDIAAQGGREAEPVGRLAG